MCSRKVFASSSNVKPGEWKFSSSAKRKFVVFVSQVGTRSPLVVGGVIWIENIFLCEQFYDGRGSGEQKNYVVNITATVTVPQRYDCSSFTRSSHNLQNILIKDEKVYIFWNLSRGLNCRIWAGSENCKAIQRRKSFLLNNSRRFLLFISKYFNQKRSVFLFSSGFF